MKTLAERISPDYLELQRELHARPEGYGGKGHKWAETVFALARRYDAGSVLDYGCGEGGLGRALREMPGHPAIAEYDPAVAGKEGRPFYGPSFADLVVCTDVLEHVEPDRLAAVLAHLHMLARKAVFFVIALTPANKVLSDGRNAHLIQEPIAWWQQKLQEARFELDSVEGLPFHRKYRPEVQPKRWITIGVPK